MARPRRCPTKLRAQERPQREVKHFPGFRCLASRCGAGSIKAALLSSDALARADYGDRHPPCVIVTLFFGQNKKTFGGKLDLETALAFGESVAALARTELAELPAAARRRKTG